MGDMPKSRRVTAPQGVATSLRTERLEARVTAEEKVLLVTAAELAGRGLSEFVVAAAKKAAQGEIRRGRSLQLSAEDAAAFVDALINPPAPTEALRQAARRYRTTTREARALPA